MVHQQRYRKNPLEYRDRTGFSRRDGSIRHFWSGEMTEGDPGQDPRGAPELAPLWHMLDMRPEGRAPDWYPDLDYPK
ncbi:DUF899 family protein [Kaistia soli]|uniref:DUF899 family protein n=1 Tax=Kaistia soli TaxID=446684 RepID=UPI003CC7F013